MVNRIKAALKVRINESNVVGVFQEERKACGGFGSEKKNDFEIKNTAMLSHRKRRQFIQKWCIRNIWTKILKGAGKERKRSVILQKQYTKQERENEECVYALGQFEDRALNKHAQCCRRQIWIPTVSVGWRGGVWSAALPADRWSCRKRSSVLLTVSPRSIFLCFSYPFLP